MMCVHVTSSVNIHIGKVIVHLSYDDLYFLFIYLFIYY